MRAHSNISLSGHMGKDATYLHMLAEEAIALSVTLSGGVPFAN